jgi:hypothetical protein
MAARAKTRPLVPGVTGATTRAAWTLVARAHRGELVRSLRPSLKHLIVPLDAELPRSPHQRLRTRRRIISKAHRIIDDQFREIGHELPELVQGTRGLPRQLAMLSALAALTDRHCGPMTMRPAGWVPGSSRCSRRSGRSLRRSGLAVLPDGASRSLTAGERDGRRRRTGEGKSCQPARPHSGVLHAIGEPSGSSPGPPRRPRLTPIQCPFYLGSTAASRTGPGQQRRLDRELTVKLESPVCLQ